jgi:hypothetical protein
MVLGMPFSATVSSAADSALPSGWSARKVQPIAYAAIGSPRAFKLGLQRKDDRWYLFVGEGGGGVLDGAGFRVVDVTDPYSPKAIARVPVEAGDGQITLHGNLLIAGRQLPFAPPSAGGSIEYPFRGAVVASNALASLYDISDPAKPRKLSDWIAEGWGTHRNGYPGGRYAFMSAWIKGYRGQSILVILDVSDPLHPKEAGRWWTPGQSEMEQAVAPASGYHGPPILSDDGRMLTVGYTPAVVNLDISDPGKPSLIGRLEFSPLAAVGTQAIHSVVPLGESLLHVSTEPSAPGCGKESAAFAAIVNNSDPVHPTLVSYYPRPRPQPGTGLRSFCDKEGRFGPHNVNTELHEDGVLQTAPLVFMTYFNAGLRVFEISDPHAPVEVGWFLPRIGKWAEGHRGPEDVLVDTRRNIYVSDGREGGVWILRFSERPRAAP